MPFSRSLIVFAMIGIVLARPASAVIPTATIVGKAGEVLLSQMSKSTADKQLVEMQKQMAEIRAKLDEIQEQLKQVLAALQDIRHHQDDLVDQSARNEVWASINTITANFKGWAENPRRWENAEELALQRLEDSSRYLMRNRAYLDFNDAGYAMLMERQMFKLMKKSKAFREGSFQQYVTYFHESASDASRPFTIAAMLTAARAERDENQAFIQNLPAEPLCPDYTRTVCSQHTDCRHCTYDQFTVIVRGPDGRFRHDDSKKRLLNERGCSNDRTCGDCPHGEGRPDHAARHVSFSLSILAAVPQPTSMNDHSQCAVSLNSRLDRIAVLDVQIQKLEEAQQVCLALEEQAKKFAAE